MRRTGSVVAAIWLLLAVCRSSIFAGFQSEPEVSSPANEAAVRLISEDIPGELCLQRLRCVVRRSWKTRV